MCIRDRWILRQQGLYLSGLLSIALVSLAMLLATRSPWLEAPLGGMDPVYRSHKWAGILACAFAALHWLIEMSSDLLKAVIGRQGRAPKEKFNGLPRLPAPTVAIGRFVSRSGPLATTPAALASALRLVSR